MGARRVTFGIGNTLCLSAVLPTVSLKFGLCCTLQPSYISMKATAHVPHIGWCTAPIYNFLNTQVRLRRRILAADFGDAAADRPVFVLILCCHRNFGSMDSGFLDPYLILTSILSLDRSQDIIHQRSGRFVLSIDSPPVTLIRSGFSIVEKLVAADWLDPLIVKPLKATPKGRPVKKTKWTLKIFYFVIG